jgi:hypothetical protein
MKRVLSLAGVLLAISLVAMPVRAQIFRAYVASYGVDTNPCTIASPCRLLPAALAAVQDGGEVWLLDSANFNTGIVSIGKNVSILAIPGEVGSIVALGAADAISIAPGLKVALKNLSITSNANSPGNNGIHMSTGSLSVQDAVISVPGFGIWLDGAGSVSVHHSVLRDSYVGVAAYRGGSADVSGSKFVNMAFGGVYAAGDVASVTTYAHVRDCEFAQAGSAVEAAGVTNGGTARISVHDSSFSGSTYAVLAASFTSGGNAIVTVGASAISRSTVALYQTGGTSAVLQSLGNNFVVNNDLNTQGTITSVGGL